MSKSLAPMEKGKPLSLPMKSQSSTGWPMTLPWYVMGTIWMVLESIL